MDYSLDARLDPAARTLHGAGWITYHNRSPDTLAALHWHLYQNLFRERVRPPRGLLARAVPATRGITVHRVEARGVALAPEIDGTRMRTALPAPLAPGDSLRVFVRWEYEIPRSAALRTGSAGGDVGVAQWYPQVAVYDDLRGWDDTRYRGRGEFYLEYGDWDVRLDVPAGFVVAATGTLANADSVLDAGALARLRAASADSTVTVLRGPMRAGNAAGGAGGAVGEANEASAFRRWRFTARDVRDFAWAASPDFVWRATRTRGGGDRGAGVLVQTFNTPRQARAWADAPAEVAAGSWIRDLHVTPPLLGLLEFPVGDGARIAPSLGANRVDGGDLGARVVQPVGPGGAELRAAFRRGALSGALDGWVSAVAPVPALGGRSLLGAQLAAVDGRVGADVELTLAGRSAGPRAPRLTPGSSRSRSRRAAPSARARRSSCAPSAASRSATRPRRRRCTWRGPRRGSDGRGGGTRRARRPTAGCGAAGASSARRRGSAPPRSAR